MASAAHIGGVGAGLQELMKAAAPARQEQSSVGGERQSFASQFQSLQGVGAKSFESAEAEGTAARVPKAKGAPVKAADSDAAGNKQARLKETNEAVDWRAPVVSAATHVEPALPAGDDAVAGTAPRFLRAVTPARVEDRTSAAGPSGSSTSSESVLVKAGSATKLVEPGKRPDRVQAEKSAEATSGIAVVAGIPIAPVPTIKGPIAPEIAAVAVGLAKGAMETGSALRGGGKPLAGRVRDVKISRGDQVRPGAGSQEAGKFRADGSSAGERVQIAIPVSATQPNVAASADGMRAGTESAVVSLPHVSVSPNGGLGKVSESGHREAVHEWPEQVEGGVGGGGETRTLVSTPNVLEVGITGGAHGWLRVRAELGKTGEVTASLVASSSASADALHKELGAMSAYLKSEVVGVSSLAVTAIEKGGAAQGSVSQGSACGSGSAGDGAGGQSARRRGDSDAKPALWAGSGSGHGGPLVPAALLGAGVGGWLNVRV